MYGKVKRLSLGAAAKASANSASKSYGLDPKMSDKVFGFWGEYGRKAET